MRATLPLLVIMLALGLAAIVPPFMFEDRGADLARIALLQLRAEASRGYAIPPGVMQVTEIRAHGEYPYWVEGTVVHRWLFGLTVATTHYYNHATRYDLDRARLLGSLVGFLLAEAFLGFLMWRSARQAVLPQGR
jgi:hypothetical protein